MGRDDSTDRRKWDARDWALAATSTALLAVTAYTAWRTYRGFQEYKLTALEEQVRFDTHDYLHSHRQPYSNRNPGRSNPNVFSSFG